MKFLPYCSLALLAGASFLFAGPALAQQPAPGFADEPPPPGVASDAPFEEDTLVAPQEPWEPDETALPEFAQIIPPVCFDAAGEFSLENSPAICGTFEGAPGTEGGVGPTGTVFQTDPAPGVAMQQPAPGAAMQQPAPGPAATPPAGEPAPVPAEGELYLEEGAEAPVPTPRTY